MSNIFIRSGPGFIGAHLYKHCIKLNNKVVVLDNLFNISLKSQECLKPNKNFRFQTRNVTDLVKVNDLVNQSDIAINMAEVVGIKHIMEKQGHE